MKKDNEYLNNLRHSAAHLLAAAVMELWPNAKRTIGPAIENGFYFDFDFGKEKVSEEDFRKIEDAMRRILPSWKSFEKHLLDSKSAKREYPKNEFKHELIDEFSQEGKKEISFYKSGSYWDLCRGGHIENPAKELQHFKLLSVAGAYWRGNEKNKMLTRIYGTAFPSQKELDEHLANLEKAKQHDHRKLGKEMELFAISEDVGAGLILWLPNGNILKEEVEKWAKKTEHDWGYLRVTTPNITKSGLYYTSGHLPYYKADMYPPMLLEGKEEYYLKPMNCPHHHMIYKSKAKSYRDLPLRLAEYGTCYRYEASGELFGLMRVRGFAQNDSHIYCSPEQAVDEFVKVMELHEYYYKTLGIKDYYLELALRDPKNKKKYHGNEKMWREAEKLMREAVKRVNIPMVEVKGNAAFYGPKIDFIIRSSIGREFAISTNQIDLFMGERFGLKYTDKSGVEKTPVIIHRAPLGSHERFIGFLIEHFGGSFPVWLSPLQVKILPITDKQLNYATEINKALAENEIRSDIDDRNETLQSKIRDAQIQKVPYIVILGGREQEKKTLSVRLRGSKDTAEIRFDKFAEVVKNKIKAKSLDL